MGQLCYGINGGGGCPSNNRNQFQPSGGVTDFLKSVIVQTKDMALLHGFARKSLYSAGRAFAQDAQGTGIQVFICNLPINWQIRVPGGVACSCAMQGQFCKIS